MSTEFISEALHTYCVQHSTPETERLQHIHRQTHLRTHVPIMLSGHLQGRVLSMMSHMIKPQYILEIGTFTGYSAACLAEGLQPGGKVISIDSNEETTAMASEFLHGLPIELQLGNALQIIPKLIYTFDLVFIDADKINYQNYLDAIYEKVRPGGFILSDNVLFHGEVLNPEEAGKNGKAMHLYNQKMTTDIRFEHVLLPLRDGLMLTRKK